MGSDMAKPQIVIRPYRVRKDYIPVGKTVLEELIMKGLLKVVPLTPLGRAKGITLESIIEYQRLIMGLQPLPDDKPEIATKIGQEPRGNDQANQARPISKHDRAGAKDANC
jgi:hypothetical protein